MVAKVLTPYREPLSVDQIAEGMNAATANAQRLAADARLLLENHRWPTAASVAALSIEESGKVTILRRFLTATPADIKQLWKEYRSHTSKNRNWILPDLVENGATRLEDFRPLVDAASDHPEILDATKQIGLYTDCLSAATWSIPASVIDEGLARSLVRAAEILSPGRKVTVRELDLWVKHLAPVWNRHPDLMKSGLVEWYAALQQEGLMPAGKNRMQIFVRDGLSESQADMLRGDGDA